VERTRVRVYRPQGSLFGLAGWAVFAFVTWRYISLSVELVYQQPLFVHLDWHAYFSGARQLFDSSLYRVPLGEIGLPIPVPSFNNPPLAALIAGPLVPLGPLVGGVLWQLANALSLGWAATALGRLVGLSWRNAFLRAGMALGLYAALGGLLLRDELAYWWTLVLGNNSYLVLGLVAGFAVAFRFRRDRLAGAMLGIAIGVKVWPLALVPLVVRERRWWVLGVAAGIGLLQALLSFAWLGFDIGAPMLAALRVSDESNGQVFGLNALKSLIEWWPTWSSVVVAVLLLVLPLRGLSGIGAGVLAGIALVPNLWGHYLPAFVFGLALLIVPGRRRGEPGE
jgi:Glycosyltransferase family 87